MRIALFSETYLPQRDGVSIILDRLVRSLCRDGHEVLVATASEGPHSNGVPLPRGCTAVRVPSIPLPRYPDLRLAVPLSPGVTRAVKRFKPDVVHLATAYSLGLIGLRTAKSLGIPVVTSFHACIPDLLPYYGIRWGGETLWRYLKWFHTHVALTFCPSEVTAALLRDRGFKNVRVWAHGVETERFSPAHRCPATRERLGPADTVRLLYVGRLTPEKDLPVLFDAYRRVCAANSSQPVHLTMAGDGVYASRTQAQAPPDVSFVGYLEGEALTRTYASADVFVFPSRDETQGNVVLEAMSSGLPVIGMAAGGVLDNLHHEVNGLLCVPGDPQSFAQGILKLVHQPQLRAELGRNARTWAEGRAWELTLAPLVAGYREAMDVG